jgi:MFS family permease
VATTSPVAVIRETAGAVASVARNPDLRRVQLSLLAALLGDAAYATAITVFAYREGGAAAVGAFTAARLVAAAVLAPVGAAAADRFQRRPTLVVCNLLRALLVGGAAVCLGLDVEWAVYVLAAGAGVLNAPFRSTQRAWMPALARTPEELTAANAAGSTIESLSVFVGPALAAALLVATDVGPVLWFNVAAFVVSTLLLVRVTSRPRAAAADATGREGLLGELAGGFRMLGGDRDLRAVTGQICAQTFVGGAVKVVLIVLAVEVMTLGASGVGLLDAIIGVGAVVGGVVALAHSGAQRLGRDLTVGVLFWSAPLGLIALWPHPVTVVVTLLLLGLANPLVDVNLDTIVQRMTPDHLLARAFGALDTCYIATSAIGAFATPLLLDALGLRWTLVAIGGPVLALAVLSWPRMARLDVRLVPPPGLDVLRAIRLFALLPPGDLEALARGAGRVSAAAGTVVIAEGEPGDLFYVILEGEVRVTQEGRRLRVQGAGDFFGEIALLHDVPRTATVTSTIDTELLTLPREVFLRVLTGEGLSAAHEVAGARLATR